MPEDFVYKQTFAGKKSDHFSSSTKEYNKEQTERFIFFKEKLSKVVKQLTKIDFQKNHKKIYDLLLNLNSVRNDIIHLRSTKTENQKYFYRVFEQIININLEPFVNAVREFVNTITPDFIEFEEENKTSKDVVVYNFENHRAFSIDISIFLKVFKSPSKKIKLVIPKSNDKDYQFTLNWIMQNLDILAKEQDIFFPKINTNKEDKVEIEITKISQLTPFQTSV